MVLAGVRVLGFVQFTEELADGGHLLRIKLIDRAWVDGHAHAAGLGVYAERRLEQVVAVLRDLRVEPWVRVLDDDVLQRGLVQALRGRVSGMLEV